MKRFLVFEGLQYYPCGGWDDFTDHYDTEEEALLSVKCKDVYEWYQIVDTQTMEVVK
jgi:hypothetical protein